MWGFNYGRKGRPARAVDLSGLRLEKGLLKEVFFYRRPMFGFFPGRERKITGGIRKIKSFFVIR
jgi:hypothetical protein